MKRRACIALIGLVAGAGCGSDDEGPAAARVSTVVVQQLAFSREADDGIAAGFDLDGLVTDGADPRTCFKTDFTGPDGTPGVDNQLARILPVIDLVGEGALDGLVQNAVNEGRLLMIFEVTTVGDRAEVRVYRGQDIPLLGTDGLILPGQTLGLHADAPDLGEAVGTIVDNTAQVGPFALRVPLIIFSQPYEVFMPNAYVQLTLPSEGAPGRGMIGGGIPIEQLATIIQTASNFSQEYDRLFGDAVRDSADLALNQEGNCTEMSAAFTLQLVSAFFWE